MGPPDRTLAVAALGRSALRGTALQPLFDEAVALLAETLGVDFAKVLELQPEGDRLLMVAGVGWTEGLVGQATVPSGPDSQAGYTLGVQRAVVVRNLPEETRFRGPALLIGHGVVSGMSVIIGNEASPWGVLGVHARGAREFTDHDISFLEAVAHILAEAIGRVKGEAEVRDREHRLSLIADAMPVLISYLDRDLVYRYCNARYTEWFGLEADQLVGHPIDEVLGPEAFAAIEPAIRRVLAGERAIFETLLPYRHGPPRYVRAEYLPHLAENGEVLGFYAMIGDISERIRSQASQARLASIVEHSHDAIVGKDLDGRITSWNAAAEGMYGYTADEMVGESIERIFPENRKEEMRSILDSIRRGEALRAMETVRVRKDGKAIEVMVSVSPVRDAAGRLLGASAIAHDLSGIRRAERAMRESEERLKVATEAAGIGIFDWNLRTGEIRWDARVRSIWGVDDDEPIDFSRFLAAIDPEDHETTKTAIDRSLDPAGDGKHYAEYRVVHPTDGKVRWIAATGRVSFDEGEPVRMVGTVQDISGRKKADAQKEEWARRLSTQLELTRKAEDQLRRSNRDLEEFTGIVTHDLRNPLGSALFTVELIKESLAAGNIDLVGPQAELLHDSLLQMDRLVRELHAQALSRNPDRLLQDVCLGEALAEARKGAALLLGKHGGELVADCTLPTVRGNPIMLVQLFANLIDNAVKYRDDPAPVIRVGVSSDATHHLVTVSDNGRGIPPEDRDRIFHSNERGSNAGEAPGSGLGLAFCRRIMEAHGGTIAIADSNAPGAVFELRFPRCPESMEKG